MTILLHILLSEDFKMAKKLIRRGADINHIDSNGNSLLIKLTQLEKADAVQFLLDKGALQHLTDDEGKDACDYAKANGLAEKIPIFLNCSIRKKKDDMAKLKRMRGEATMNSGRRSSNSKFQQFFNADQSRSRGASFKNEMGRSRNASFKEMNRSSNRSNDENDRNLKSTRRDTKVSGKKVSNSP